MEIKQVSQLAKTCLNNTDYEHLMAKVNNKEYNSARLFVEDKIDEIVFAKDIRKPAQMSLQLKSLKQIDNFVTNEYINQIETYGATKVSN